MSEHRIVLATTSSVQNSGLLDVLIPRFQESPRIEIQVSTAGSGRALQMLSRGDADVVISHAPEAESELLRIPGRWNYRKIMFNDFLLVGPPDDPAQVKRSVKIADAMRRIATSHVKFISRGDASGTHEREQALWRLAGATPDPTDMVAAGSGMGSTLRITSSTRAYTLTDRATYAQLRRSLSLATVFEGGSELMNTYAVIVSARVDDVRLADAHRFANWLADGEGRRVIAQFRVADGGEPAFHIWPEGKSRQDPRDLP